MPLEIEVSSVTETTTTTRIELARNELLALLPDDLNIPSNAKIYVEPQFQDHGGEVEISARDPIIITWTTTSRRDRP